MVTGVVCFFFQAEDGIRDSSVTGVQTCALPISLTQLRTVKAFVEGAVFADAVAACEKAPSSTPFKWNGGKQTAVIGLNSVKLNKDTIIASYTLVADNVYCDYDPIKKNAHIGAKVLERESF